MSVIYNPGLSTVAVKQFAIDFNLAMQQKVRKFAGKILEVHGVVGGDYNMKMADDWTMKDRGAYHSDVAATIPSYRPIVVNRQEKVGNVPSDIFEQTKVNASERIIQAQNAANALNRMQDQIVYNGMKADLASMDTVDCASNLTVDKLIDISSVMNKKNVPMEDRYIVVYATQLDSMLKEEKATNSNYVGDLYGLQSGKLTSFMGFEFIVFGNMKEGGISLDGGKRQCFAYYKQAMEGVWWMEPGIEIVRTPTAFSYNILSRLLMGSKVLDPDGFVYVTCTES